MQVHSTAVTSQNNRVFCHQGLNYLQGSLWLLTFHLFMLYKSLQIKPRFALVPWSKDPPNLSTFFMPMVPSPNPMLSFASPFFYSLSLPSTAGSCLLYPISLSNHTLWPGSLECLSSLLTLNPMNYFHYICLKSIFLPCPFLPLFQSIACFATAASLPLVSNTFLCLKTSQYVKWSSLRLLS